MKKLFLTLILVLAIATPAAAITLDDSVLDAGLSVIRTTATVFFVGTDETYANRLGSVVIDSDDFGAITNGTTQGRILPLLALTVLASGTGTATHYGFYDGSKVLYANTLTAGKGMVSGSSYEYDAMPYAVQANDAVSE